MIVKRSTLLVVQLLAVVAEPAAAAVIQCPALCAAAPLLCHISISQSINKNRYSK